ncbi:MAG: type II toxin-antitoxin system VapC family toxin [Myxococcales bacterium]|nr:type II toxin-antitoxin system VapC family toxin [Myxococcales bacterium]MCB9736594.1 type II toxin-antitoxin system VapC family toxin [Deltaproteobacteria bacterium]
MSYLLDTHVVLWWLTDAPDLSPAAREILADPANRLLVSAASAWEVATKFRLGKLPSAAVIASDFPGWVERMGATELPMTMAHAARAGAFTAPHRDPFDRMLAAQALLEAVPLVSRDAELDAFGVTRLW